MDFQSSVRDECASLPRWPDVGQDLLSSKEQNSHQFPFLSWSSNLQRFRFVIECSRLPWCSVSKKTKNTGQVGKVHQWFHKALTTVETEFRWCLSSRQFGSCLSLGLAPHMPEEFSLWCPYPYSVPPNPSTCISHHEFSTPPSYTPLKCIRSREYSLVATTMCPESQSGTYLMFLAASRPHDRGEIYKHYNGVRGSWWPLHMNPQPRSKSG